MHEKRKTLILFTLSLLIISYLTGVSIASIESSLESLKSLPPIFYFFFGLFSLIAVGALFSFMVIFFLVVIGMEEEVEEEAEQSP